MDLNYEIRGDNEQEDPGMKEADDYISLDLQIGPANGRLRPLPERISTRKPDAASSTVSFSLQAPLCSANVSKFKDGYGRAASIFKLQHGLTANMPVERQYRSARQTGELSTADLLQAAFPEINNSSSRLGNRCIQLPPCVSFMLDCPRASGISSPLATQTKSTADINNVKPTSTFLDPMNSVHVSKPGRGCSSLTLDLNCDSEQEEPDGSNHTSGLGPLMAESLNKIRDQQYLLALNLHAYIVDMDAPGLLHEKSLVEFLHAKKNSKEHNLDKHVINADVYQWHPWHYTSGDVQGSFYFCCITKYSRRGNVSRDRMTKEGGRWKQQGMVQPILNTPRGFDRASKTYLSYIPRGGSKANPKGYFIPAALGRVKHRHRMIEIALEEDLKAEKRHLKQRVTPKPFLVVCVLRNA